MNCAILSNESSSASLRDRLLEVGDRAGLEPLLPLADARDDVHRDVPRVADDA